MKSGRLSVVLIGLFFIPLMSFASPLAAVVSIGKTGERLNAIESINPIIKTGRLAKVAKSSLTMNKSDNIQSLLELAIKENRINFSKHVVYIKAFNKLKNGDKLLLKCLKNRDCNLDTFSNIANKSPLRTQGVSKNSIINANIMNKHAGVKPIAHTTFKSLPKEAKETINKINKNGPFPYKKDGTTWGNYGNPLPKQKPGYYKEYTVKTPGEKYRGARRIIKGEKGELYYTDDHYKTFQRISEI